MSATRPWENTRIAAPMIRPRPVLIIRADAAEPDQLHVVGPRVGEPGRIAQHRPDRHASAVGIRAPGSRARWSPGGAACSLEVRTDGEAVVDADAGSGNDRRRVDRLGAHHDLGSLDHLTGHQDHAADAAAVAHQTTGPHPAPVVEVAPTTGWLEGKSSLTDIRFPSRLVTAVGAHRWPPRLVDGRLLAERGADVDQPSAVPRAIGASPAVQPPGGMGPPRPWSGASGSPGRPRDGRTPTAWLPTPTRAAELALPPVVVVRRAPDAHRGRDRGGTADPTTAQVRRGRSPGGSGRDEVRPRRARPRRRREGSWQTGRRKQCPRRMVGPPRGAAPTAPGAPTGDSQNGTSRPRPYDDHIERIGAHTAIDDTDVTLILRLCGPAAVRPQPTTPVDRAICLADVGFERSPISSTHFPRSALAPRVGSEG